MEALPFRPFALVLLAPLALAQSTKLNPPLAVDPPVSGGDVRQALSTPDGRRIVYVADQDRAGLLALYSAPADGGAPPVKLAEAASERDSLVRSLVLSPDGTRVAFSFSYSEPFALHTVPVLGGSAAVLLTERAIAFDFTPDGGSIVYVARELTGDELRVAPSDGSGVATVLATAPEIFAPRSSPDGRWLVYLSGPCTNCELGVASVPMDGSAPSVRLDPPGTAFSITPDSRSIVYVTRLEGQLIAAPIDGSAGRIRLDPPTESRTAHFALEPAGARVVFTTSFLDYTAFPPSLVEDKLYSVPLDGSALALRLTPPFAPNGGVTSFQLTPDGARVVYRADQRLDGVFELFDVPIGGGAVQLLSGALPSGGDVEDFRVSPDSIGVVFRADKTFDGVIQLYGVPFSGGGAFLLSGPLGGGGNVADYQISPDDLHVVYRADRQGDALELYRVAITGGASTKLNAPLPASGSVSSRWLITPDSARVAYIADQDVAGVSELFSTPILGGPAVQLNAPLDPGPPTGDVSGSMLTPDGSTVVYVADGEHHSQYELYRVPIVGGSVATLNEPFLAGGGLAYAATRSTTVTADGARVVFTARRNAYAPVELYSVPIDRGTPPVRLNQGFLGTSAGVVWYELSSDGVHVVYLGDDQLRAARVDGTGTPIRLSLPGQRVTFMSNGQVHSEQRLSPDGTRVVYRALTDLYSAPLDGSEPAVKLNPSFVASGSVGLPFQKIGVPVESEATYTFAISANSRWVVYAADARIDERYELFSVAIDGRGPGCTPARLNGPLAAGGDVVLFAMSPDGQRVAYYADEAAELRFEFFSVPVSGPRHVQSQSGVSGWRVKLNPPLASNDNVRVPVRVAFTPDGADVFFLQQARGHLPRLLLAPMDGHSVARQLALGAGSPLVSADGSWAVYPAGNMLFSVRVDGSQGPLQLNQPLVSGALSSSVRDTLISPDGRWVLYTADERTLGTRELFARPLDASQPTCALNGPLVANGNVWWFQVTAQADRVVYGADQELDEVFELYSSALPALP